MTRQEIVGNKFRMAPCEISNKKENAETQQSVCTCNNWWWWLGLVTNTVLGVEICCFLSFCDWSCTSVETFQAGEQIMSKISAQETYKNIK